VPLTAACELRHESVEVTQRFYKRTGRQANDDLQGIRPVAGGWDAIAVTARTRRLKV
jgi:hypothetical protein